MKVEVATPDDAPALAALGEVLHDTSSYAPVPYSRAKVEALMRDLSAGAGVVFVVRRDGEIVGGIAGAVSAHWFSEELHGYEFSFFIHPSARNGFTAMKLLNAFRIWCERKGAKSLRIGITTGIHPDKTGELYRLMGFKDAGTLFQMEFPHGH